jgi:hypothetical protein
MTTFIIKYYQNRGGDLVKVTPDIAHIFRVFMVTGKTREWVHDFTMLGLANEFIRKIRAAEISLCEAFVTAIRPGQEPNALKKLIENVLDNIKLEMTKE